MGTILAIVTLAILPLLTPWFIHAALDAAGSAELLSLTAAQAHELSDRSVEELILGPGSFELRGPDGEPFYDADERRHLGDARLLLGIFLLIGGLAIVLVGAVLSRAGPWRRVATWAVISRAGLATAAVVAALGIISLVAFDSLFTLFHQLFFPGGNWSFDADTQHLVQLYPFRFWQIAAAALGLLVFGLGILTWLLGRWVVRHSDPGPAPDPDSTPASAGD